MDFLKSKWMNIYRHIYHITITLILINLCSCKKESIVEPQLSDIKMELLSRLNALRGKGCQCGLDSLQSVKRVIWNDRLEKAAADHAIDMYEKRYFTHISPSGATPGDWAKQEGYNAVDLGENIAQNYNTVEETMIAWKNSPEHCIVMMDSIYTEIGAAQYGNIWVVLFGKPK